MKKVLYCFIVIAVLIAIGVGIKIGYDINLKNIEREQFEQFEAKAMAVCEEFGCQYLGIIDINEFMEAHDMTYETKDIEEELFRRAGLDTSRLFARHHFVVGDFDGDYIMTRLLVKEIDYINGEYVSIIHDYVYGEHV